MVRACQDKRQANHAHKGRFLRRTGLRLWRLSRFMPAVMWLR
jgi:hypothetical protein